MRVRLLQLDGKLPNIALMRIAAHHRELGDDVDLVQAGNESALGLNLWDVPPDRVYASAIFERTRPLVAKLLEMRPDAIVGGSGVSLSSKIEDHGITTKRQDYSVYPDFLPSIGFTQRGCRLRCPFCIVPEKEGRNAEEQTIADLWRGEGHPKHLLLLDNDFFGQPRWRERLEEMRGFRVCFSQGINARLIKKDSAWALGQIDCYDDAFTARRIYTAWDNADDEERLFKGLNLLVDVAGFKPDQIMVYMLIGYWPGETTEDRLYRQAKLRAFGARPYPMPFERTPELVGFQRWVLGAYDKPSKRWPSGVPWDTWVAAKYQPKNLGKVSA